jgi:hypothetical protein
MMDKAATRLSAVRTGLRVGGICLALLMTACGTGDGQVNVAEPAAGSAGSGSAAAERVLARESARIEAAAAAIDSIFQPLPLLRPAQEQELRRFLNAQQLARARALGVGRQLPAERLAALEREGRLVRLEDTGHWVVRDLDHSQPLAVPSVHALLTELGRRFHARLADLGAPPYRMEVSSVLRTAADQAALRRVNPNAALGESTHEYGTTVDVLYSAFAAPAEPIVAIDAAEAPWLEPFLRRHAEVAAERVAGRRALELKAVLGHVLLEMQREGKVMVTIEQLQPVYHMTVAREL